jgi:KDO2-lipid IV(A) lauroyltransferase
LYQPLSNPHSDLFMRKARERALSAQLLPKSPDTSMRVVRWVKSGNCVGMLGDLYERRGSPATFFGKPTLTNPFPAMLARRLDVPLVSVRTIRLPGVRFRLELDEIAVPRTDNVQADIQAATQAMLDQFESWIRLRPGEWMWVQKRWFRNRENRTPMEPAA